MKNPSKCYEHGHNRGRHRREKIDPILEVLPKYTGGRAWDRCTYCAYLKGREDGLREAREVLNTLE